MLRLVIGVGNEWRGDDAAGLEAARRAGGVEIHDPFALLGAWAGHDHVAILDAARSGAVPGTVHELRADRAPLDAALLRSSSSHAFGVSDVIELARALDRLPRRVDVYAIEGGSFEAGATLSPAVERAVETLADRLT